MNRGERRDHTARQDRPDRTRRKPQRRFLRGLSGHGAREPKGKRQLQPQRRPCLRRAGCDHPQADPPEQRRFLPVAVRDHAPGEGAGSSREQSRKSRSCTPQHEHRGRLSSAERKSDENRDAPNFSGRSHRLLRGGPGRVPRRLHGQRSRGHRCRRIGHRQRCRGERGILCELRAHPAAGARRGRRRPQGGRDETGGGGAFSSTSISAAKARNDNPR